MPVFEFDCAGCNLRREELVPSAATPVPCPMCGHPMTRVFTTFFGWDPQGNADRAYDEMGPGEKFLHHRQQQIVEDAMAKGTCGKVTVGDRTPTPCKPRHTKTTY